jgi:hypothetical protein
MSKPLSFFQSHNMINNCAFNNKQKKEKILIHKWECKLLLDKNNILTIEYKYCFDYHFLWKIFKLSQQLNLKNSNFFSVNSKNSRT